MIREIQKIVATVLASLVVMMGILLSRDEVVIGGECFIPLITLLLWVLYEIDMIKKEK